MIKKGSTFSCPKCKMIILARTTKDIKKGELISTNNIESRWKKGNMMICPNCDKIVTEIQNLKNWRKPC